MNIIRKEFEFSASHQLHHLLEGHPCKRLHGHNYKVVIELRSWALNTDGFVLDYRELDSIKRYLDNAYDHRHLNDVIPIPTAEIIAKKIFDDCKEMIPFLHAVEVSETPKTMARYEIDGK